LTIKVHAKRVSFVKSSGIPTLLLGGEYNVRRVARCWMYETAMLLDQKVDGTIPCNDYWQYCEADHKLHVLQTAAENKSDEAYLERLTIKMLENLRSLNAAPSVQLQEAPPIRPFDGKGNGEEFDSDGSSFQECVNQMWIFLTTTDINAMSRFKKF
jgi:hypothetical protein